MWEPEGKALRKAAASRAGKGFREHNSRELVCLCTEIHSWLMRLGSGCSKI